MELEKDAELSIEFLEERIEVLTNDILRIEAEIPSLKGEPRLDAKDCLALTRSTLQTNTFMLQLLKRRRDLDDL